MRRGFTLIELAIVMVIIGVLFGAVLLLYNMKDNAEAKGAMKQLVHYDSSIEQFRARYNYLPGDSRQFNGVGNNNWRIEDDNGTQGLGAEFSGEVAYFWVDLELTGTLVYAYEDREGRTIQTASDIDTDIQSNDPTELDKLETAVSNIFTATITDNIKVTGQSINVPEVKIGVDGTGIIVTNDNSPLSSADSWRNRGLNGVYLVGKVTDITAADPAIEPSDIGDSFTPSQLSLLDQKFDDGVGNTGKIQASSVAGTCLASGEYDQSISDPVCSAGIAYLLKTAEVNAPTAPSGGAPACGDGNVDSGETCDDGNGNTNDGCEGCQAQPICGNSLIENFGMYNEVCDDGNTTDYDGCSSGCNCSHNCGNSSVECSEQCDDGNASNGDGCDSSCQTEGPSCGDGIVNGVEQCDDGNQADGDGCTSVCQYPVCGDGYVSSGEQCDDGNTYNGDGCDSGCQNGNGPTCGNGVVESGETCDDSNTSGGDGCDSSCQTEVCADPGNCGNSPTCGSWDSNSCQCVGVDTSGCTNGGGTYDSASCNCNCSPGYNWDGTNCVSSAVCGNGSIESGEQCDDGNNTDGDGCSSCQTGPTCNFNNCESWNGSSCVNACVGQQWCNTGFCQDPTCDSNNCETLVNGSCVNSCTGGQTCSAGACGCNVWDQQNCANSCGNWDSNACSCSGSYCVGSQTCNGSGTCNDPTCWWNNCETLSNGSCVSSCNPGETCNGSGSCVSSCNSNNCESWNGSSCASSCDGNNCMTCNGSGSCVSMCNGGESCNGSGGCVPAGPVCGNSSCESGEDCNNCSSDCGACPYCGDGSCNNGETCDDGMGGGCSDCGSC